MLSVFDELCIGQLPACAIVYSSARRQMDAHGYAAAVSPQQTFVSEHITLQNVSSAFPQLFG